MIRMGLRWIRPKSVSSMPIWFFGDNYVILKTSCKALVCYFGKLIKTTNVCGSWGTMHDIMIGVNCILHTCHLTSSGMQW